jgi:hypothetical protein
MKEVFQGTYDEILDALEAMDDEEYISMYVRQAKILIQAAIAVKMLQGSTDNKKESMN